MNIWATWCPACVHELPTLGQLQSKLGGSRFTVVALSIDDGGTNKVSAYLKKLGLSNLPVYLDPAERMLEALGVGNALPLSFIIDHRGQVRGYMKGAADWSSPEAEALIGYFIGRISS